MNKKITNILKIISLIIIIAIIICAFCNTKTLRHCTPENMKTFIDSYGMFSPIIYIILFTFVPLTLFPDSILAIAGGMCFGMMGGFIYTMIGAILGGTLSFFLASILGHKVFNKFIKKDISNLEDAIKNRGFLLVFVLRLIPLFPFDIISYAAGFSGVKFKDFALATLLGIIPGIFVFVNIGDKATDIGSSSFYMSIALLVGLIVISYVLKKKISLQKIKN
ncbi:TVP38/TMEM64 family protein [Clostridium tagluense]|uniref:TVP38/TMEM64 family protein n=1 Tax=Clostridium tagluense TaxID=360422 RepID=UPI001C6F123E|nr:TVP38/TMEM64 family protein [Clostridium tagluense]MBW9155882.1 TVP38/TMEM64 family protein [Clostridium tagluense]WLC63935.1 TVP38/TMEM64 family protein [Clostridium tagluense]